jgi:hypothetical protein
VDLNAVADELYVLAPAAFIERRNALVALARSDGDAELAGEIKALRRPTVGAALTNALVREGGEVIASFFTLGAQLRDAQARGDGQQMRALASRRQQLMRDLDGEIAELATERRLTATRAVLQDVHATMLAALSNPRAEEVVRGGRLESALNDDRFGADPPAVTGGQPSASRTGAEGKLNEAIASAAAADHAVEKLAADLSSARRELAELDNQLEETLKQARRLERDKLIAGQLVATAMDAHADASKRAEVLRAAADKARSTYEREIAD